MGLLFGAKWYILAVALAAFATYRYQDLRSPTLPSFYSRDHSPVRQIVFPERVVAVGDLHGDLRSTLNVLKLAGLVKEDDGFAETPVDFSDWTQSEALRIGNVKWTGGRTVLVQTGDVVDRGHDTIALYALLRNLRAQALSAGGAVLPLLGNHEIMNLSGDLRYVTPEDVASFGGDDNRRAAFSASGPIGHYLRGLDMIAVVGDTVFCHGGLHPMWLVETKNVSKINRRVRDAMRDGKWNSPLFREDGPVWFRTFAEGPEADVCSKLKETLDHLEVSRMVVGHTWQVSGKILSRCSNSFFIIDVGISAAYGSNLAALEILYHTEGEEGQARSGRLKVNGLYPNGKVVSFIDKLLPIIAN